MSLKDFFEDPFHTQFSDWAQPEEEMSIPPELEQIPFVGPTLRATARLLWKGPKVYSPVYWKIRLSSFF
jgi:hypothetical protein